ncbi:hypothetical protein D3H55_15835 [Bacillus salacetis]|uniref:Competence protein ComG n=1 Tax=Bacillus salacetis TaxID=2315464 RepID=A0A3A1QTN0_9BACI|nr:competence type IV pilus minor pilin ComGG [Bacillus salacetis]RIW31076.1 hypothetical protein D3H55_15835 [Bacillus salacetis]
MRNEKGFILPFAMILAAAILLFSISVSAIFISRYSYLDIMEESYRRESLMLFSIKRLYSIDQSLNGAFTYPEGVVRYEVQKEDELTRATLTLVTAEKKYESVHITFENDTKEIVDWE